MRYEYLTLAAPLAVVERTRGNVVQPRERPLPAGTTIRLIQGINRARPDIRIRRWFYVGSGDDVEYLGATVADIRAAIAPVVGEEETRNADETHEAAH